MVGIMASSFNFRLPSILTFLTEKGKKCNRGTICFSFGVVYRCTGRRKEIERSESKGGSSKKRQYYPDHEIIPIKEVVAAKWCEFVVEKEDDGTEKVNRLLCL